MNPRMQSSKFLNPNLVTERKAFNCFDLKIKILTFQVYFKKHFKTDWLVVLSLRALII